MATLDGKVAIVTGSGQGVGQGIALALAGEGAKVGVVEIVPERAQATVAEIRRRQGDATAFLCDVKVEADIVRCVDEVIGELGRIDILVNNAQEATLGPLLALSRADMERNWISGPVAAFTFMKACHEQLQNGGVVVNIASGVSMHQLPLGYGVYGAVKDGMRMLTRVAACEWGPLGIRVLCVIPAAKSPGYVLWEEADPEAAAAFVETVPLRRVGDPEIDIGRPVAFLCSSAAGYITGTNITVDGGQAYVR